MDPVMEDSPSAPTDNALMRQQDYVMMENHRQFQLLPQVYAMMVSQSVVTVLALMQQQDYVRILDNRLRQLNPIHRHQHLLLQTDLAASQDKMVH